MKNQTKMKVTMLALTFGLSSCSPQSNNQGFAEYWKFFRESPRPSKSVFSQALDPESSLTASIASSIILGEHPRTFWLADKAPGVLVINGSGWKVSGMTITRTGDGSFGITNSAIIGGPAIEIREDGGGGGGGGKYH